MAIALAALLALVAFGSATASSWTYRGTLSDGGKPAQGQYDLRLTLLDDGLALTQPLTLFGVAVDDGNFAVEVDFELDLSQAPPLQLQIEVQRSDEQGAGFVALGEPTRFDAKAALGGICWDTLGNAGTDPALNFIGTTDNQPLVLRTGNVQRLRIEPSAELLDGTPITANVIAGSSANMVSVGVRGATISGGGVPAGGEPDFGAEPNRVTDLYGTVGGGASNQAGNVDTPLGSATFAVVNGGLANTASGEGSVVGGGARNEAAASGSTISGGIDNLATGHRSALGGGSFNQASGNQSTVAGGELNRASGDQGTVGGGQNNQSSNRQSTVAGGQENMASGNHSSVAGGRRNLSSGQGSVVGGGSENTASGEESVVSGGLLNCAGGLRSWAGGSRAHVRPGSDSGAPGFACDAAPTNGAEGDRGTFVWADSQGLDFTSTAPNQFLVRATGGLGLNTNRPTPSHLTIGKDDGSNNLLALGFLGDVTRWRIGGPASGTGAAFEVQSGGDQVLLRVEDVGSSSRVGIARTPTANALEVDGAASKTTAGSWVANSDARIKTDVHEIDGALARLMTVRPVTFRYTSAYRADHPGIVDQRYYNVLAQEFAASFPDAVKGSGEFLPGHNKSTASEILQVDVHPALITTIAAVQELALRLEAERNLLAGENTVLRREVAQLNSRMARLETRLATPRAGAR